MRYVSIPHPPNLPPRWIKIYQGRKNGLAAQATHANRAKYLRSKGSWRVLKGWLAKHSNGKCWYCEAKVERAPFDVDHFRPKLGITVDGVKLPGDTGYFWMAYEWWNFRLSCQRCNRLERDADGNLYGKASEFPLQDEMKRCKGPETSISDEKPRLLDPCDDRDCQLLAHGIDGETKPFAEDVKWDCERAKYTIKQLGLNAFSTPERKKNTWRALDDLIRLAGDRPEVLEHLEGYLSPAHEYSSFFRSAIGTHRDKPWVEALL